MPNKGTRIPEWVNYMIKQAAIDTREQLGSLRYPTTAEIRLQLYKALLDRGDALALSHAEKLPSDRHIRKVRAELPKQPPISDIENPWSLGVSQDHHIPDDATGALMVVWRWAILHPSAEPLSIRTARWVSKLRWVPEAGGSSAGEAIDPEKLYKWAYLYSGRERQAELTKDKIRAFFWLDHALGRDWTLTPEIAREKLRGLTIFTPPELVMEIVQHLQAGRTQYQIYKNPPIGVGIASNNTVFKIKKLLDAGELDWMTDELASHNLLLDREKVWKTLGNTKN